MEKLGIERGRECVIKSDTISESEGRRDLEIYKAKTGGYR